MLCYDYLYDKEYYSSLLCTDHLSKEKLKWREFPEGTVFPFTGLQDDRLGGLLDKNDQYIDGAGVHKGMGWETQRCRKTPAPGGRAQDDHGADGIAFTETIRTH